MKKRIRAAAIIFKEDNLVTIYREKNVNGTVNKYYVIPGGGVEEGESIQEAVKREILEEIGIKIKLTDKYFYLDKEKAQEYFYISEYVSGTIGTGNGPEFTNKDIDKYGTYEVRLVPESKIQKIKLLPPEVKEYILTSVDINR